MLQLSLVHTLLSSQFFVAPAQAPLEQVSESVQALPSLQLTVLFALTQPEDVSQLSVVHALPSTQFLAPPAAQEPLLHVSLMVQALPSSQASVLLVFTQPEPVLQLSVVQALPSSQSLALPGWQEPLPHLSLTVQALPSSQLLVLLALTQPELVLQLSVVQALESLQFLAAPPAHEPPLHLSFSVQALPSLHEVVLLMC